MRQTILNRLMPGPLPGQHMYYDNLHNLLIIRNRAVRLTPTQYLLSMALLRQRAAWEAASRQGRFYTPLPDLHVESGIIDPYLLAKHLNNASNKLEPLGICFVRVGDEGYAVLLEQERAQQKGELACVAR